MAKIFVAGHKGMVGSAICRALEREGSNEIITAEKEVVDLCNQARVSSFFKKNKVDQVYLAAAKVGGIFANDTYPADFIYQNLMIQTNVINSAFESGVERLLFLGSSCIYPRLAAQPIKEQELLNGHLEKTNEPYAIAKIAGIKMCESYNRQYNTDYRSVMPTNLYGPGDSYHPQNSHVIPAMILKFHEAKFNKLPHISIWGSGTPRREFLYVEDMARACSHVMQLERSTYEDLMNPMCSHINIGSGTDITIMGLAQIIKDVVGYEGEIHTNPDLPDGSPRKLMDNSKVTRTGWKPEVSLEDGLKMSYQSFLSDRGQL